MYLKVSPVSRKLFRLRYQVAGKEDRLVLGSYPGATEGKREIGGMEARELFARCVNPSAEPQNANELKPKKLPPMCTRQSLR
jgi:hypothetical protein